MRKSIAMFCLPAAIMSACSSSHSSAPASPPAACHVAAESVSCVGAPPHLADVDLSGGGFFQDMYANVGLNGVLGRRVTFGDLDGDGYPDFVAVQTGVTRNLQ